ncbi:hypothetical protein SAMN05216345_11062 [Cupriavidus sp. YR651]|uniref:hypothetical protein n=1 Tax=Cupriavidus sp. YR651 TaxID=1855315 RepID=UPI00087F3144|nr:hypothetical protein [Cupriavidus sp. YR651]SDD50726.1 hypothetical protein SAMN05216345_11062 [Cupriavidus sp. YR651]
MDRATPDTAPSGPRIGHGARPIFDGPPSPRSIAYRQLVRVDGALGVVSVAMEGAASPEFSNEGAALILRLIRREMARAVEALKL